MSTKIVKKNQFLDLLEERASEYKDTEVQTNKIYRIVAEWLGVSPWRVIVPVSLIIGFGLVFVFREWAVKGVSILQWGF